MPGARFDVAMSTIASSVWRGCESRVRRPSHERDVCVPHMSFFFFFWRRCCSNTLARLVGTGDILRYAREIQFLRRKATFQLDSCSILQAEAWETQGVVPFELSVDMPICSGRRRTTKSKVCGHRWPISYLPSLPRSHRRSHVPFHDVPVVRCARALFFLYSFLGRPLRQARWCPP
jgi:hypothetical protein